MSDMKSEKIIYIVLLCFFCSLQTKAEETFTSGDFTYRVIEENKLEVVSYNGGKNLDLEIPENITFLEQYYVVQQISKDCFNNEPSKLLRSISTSAIICESQFSNCSSLEIAKIKGDIPNRAFYQCENLKEVIRKEVGNIGDFAFYNCKNLQDPIRANEIIGISAFEGCTKLKSLTFDYKLKRIGMGAFNRCPNIEKIYINDSLLEMFPFDLIKGIIPSDIMNSAVFFVSNVDNYRKNGWNVNYLVEPPIHWSGSEKGSVLIKANIFEHGTVLLNGTENCILINKGGDVNVRILYEEGYSTKDVYINDIDRTRDFSLYELSLNEVNEDTYINVVPEETSFSFDLTMSDNSLSGNVKVNETDQTFIFVPHRTPVIIDVKLPNGYKSFSVYINGSLIGEYKDNLSYKIDELTKNTRFNIVFNEDDICNVDMYYNSGGEVYVNNELWTGYSHNVNKGSNLKLKIVPNKYNVLSSVCVDDEEMINHVSLDGYLDIKDVQKNLNIVVKFESKKVNIIYEYNAEGGTLIDVYKNVIANGGKEVIDMGNSLFISMISKPGYEIDYILIDGVLCYNKHLKESWYSKSNIDKDIFVEVSFRKEEGDIPSSNENLLSNMKICKFDNGLSISNIGFNKRIQIYNIRGNKVVDKIVSESCLVNNLTNGVYLLIIDDKVVKLAY